MGVKKGNKIMVSKMLHNNSITPILENKLFFSKYLEKNELIKVPKTLGFNYNNFFYNRGNNEVSYVKEAEEVIYYLANLIGCSPNKSIFVKPIDGAQGRCCFLLTNQNVKVMLNNNALETLLNGNFIFQETVIQHAEINKIYAGSVNTIRIDTYIDENGGIHLLSALMRFGANGSFVDNISAGGFFVPIDIDTGRFKKYGMQLLEYGGNIYVEHPDTKFSFEGFEIPYFDEVKKMIKEVVKLIPNKLVGWDIAISQDGPVIIEGNHNYSPRMSEMAYGGYKNHPIYKEILKQV